MTNKVLATVRVQKNMSFSDLMDNLNEAIADVTVCRECGNLDAAQVRLIEAKNILLALSRRNMKDAGRLNLQLGSIEVGTVVEDGNNNLFALIGEYDDDEEKVFVPVDECIEHIAIVSLKKGNTSVKMMAEPISVIKKYKKVMFSI